MFRATVGPVTGVTVETRYGPLEFQLRAVTVRDVSGGLVGEFTCEDDPADFDAEASKHGWVRVGMDGSVVLVERAEAALQPLPRGIPTPAAPVVPEPTVTELAGSAVWSLVKLGVVGVVLVCFVAACVRLVF